MQLKNLAQHWKVKTRGKVGTQQGKKSSSTKRSQCGHFAALNSKTKASVKKINSEWTTALNLKTTIVNYADDWI